MTSAPLPFSVQQWERCLKHDRVPALYLSVRRPVFPETGKTERLERYFAGLTRQWCSRWETALFPAAREACRSALAAGKAFSPWRAGLTFTVTLWREPLLSLYVQAEERTDGPHPFLMRMGETWDCATGFPRPLRSFFPPHQPRWRSRLLQSIREQAAERVAGGESLLDPDCAAVIDRAFDPERFYLTETGAEIFYPLYILGPYAEGIPVFSVPLPSDQAKGCSAASSTDTL